MSCRKSHTNVNCSNVKSKRNGQISAEFRRTLTPLKIFDETRPNETEEGSEGSNLQEGKTSVLVHNERRTLNALKQMCLLEGISP